MGERICEACGCALSDGDKACPLCGATAASQTMPMPDNVPIGATTASQASGSFVQQSMDAGCIGVPQKKSKAFLVAGLCIGAAILLFLVFVIGSAIAKDNNLKEQALNSEASSISKVEPARTFSAGMGNTAGNIAGGGIIVPDKDSVFLAFSSGIFYYGDISQTEEQDVPCLSADRAACLNLYQQKIYYVAGSGSSIEGSAEGSSIRVIEAEASKNAKTQSSQVLYRAEAGSVIGSLQVKDGWMYFTVQKESSLATLLKMPCDGSSDSVVLAQRECVDSWCFVEGSLAYLVTTTDKSWVMESTTLSSDGMSFSQSMKGEGQLATACFNNGSLYFSLKKGSSTSYLFKQDTGGGYAEFTDAPSVCRIASVGDITAVVTSSGGLYWIDGISGLSHDLSDVISLYLPGASPLKISVGIYDDYLCLSDEKGRFIAWSLNADTYWGIDLPNEANSNSSTKPGASQGFNGSSLVV